MSFILIAKENNGYEWLQEEMKSILNDEKGFPLLGGIQSFGFAQKAMGFL